MIKVLILLMAAGAIAIALWLAPEDPEDEHLE
jgi:hypothetical protein